MSGMRDKMAQLVADIMWGESGEQPDEQDYYNADLILALVRTSPDACPGGVHTLPLDGVHTPGID